MAKYYLLDELKVNEAHVVFYLTDTDGLICLEEISEDEFLDHYANNKNTKEK
jgi:hypothetical protein